MEPPLLSLPPPSQSVPSSMWIILLLVCATSATALPTGTGSSTPVRSGGLAIALCTPFLVLAALKYVYLRHRRAQSIHESGKPSPLLGLGLSISNSTSRLFSPSTRTSVQGYLVGMLGSPDWETRIQARVDRAQRRTSKELYVQTLCYMCATLTPTFHSIAFSPRPTSSRATSPNMSPPLPYSSLRYSCHSGRTGSHSSRRYDSRRGTIGSSHNSSTSHSGSKSKRSAQAGSGSVLGDASHFGSGSHRHKRAFSSHGSHSGSASRSHSRSLSLSFLSMDLELGVISPDLRTRDYPTLHRRNTPYTPPLGAQSITNCSTVHPGSPPCLDSTPRLDLGLSPTIAFSDFNLPSSSTSRSRNRSNIGPRERRELSLDASMAALGLSDVSHRANASGSSGDASMNTSTDNSGSRRVSRSKTSQSRSSTPKSIGESPRFKSSHSKTSVQAAPTPPMPGAYLPTAALERQVEPSFNLTSDLSQNDSSGSQPATSPGLLGWQLYTPPVSASPTQGPADPHPRLGTDSS